MRVRGSDVPVSGRGPRWVQRVACESPDLCHRVVFSGPAWLRSSRAPA